MEPIFTFTSTKFMSRVACYCHISSNAEAFYSSLSEKSQAAPFFFFLMCNSLTRAALFNGDNRNKRNGKKTKHNFYQIDLKTEGMLVCHLFGGMQT